MAIHEQGSGIRTLNLIRGALRLIMSLIVLAITLFILKWSFGFMRDKEIPKLLTTLVAVAIGVFGVWALFWIANDLVSWIPNRRLRESLLPFVFVGPALSLLLIYLVYPAVNTIYLSFFDRKSEAFVGLKNYAFIFNEPNIRIAFRNNVLWLITVTSVCVSLGLVIAVLVDRIKFEALAKSLIFLPMAISAVGAVVIWRFMYAFQPAGRPQIGLLNAIVVALGGEPTGWYIRPPFNNLALIVIMIWLQTGFCMVVLSAALKGVPSELIEAARIDGANELQLFFKVTVPYIRGTIITIATTVLIMVLKVFDIVYVMTRGNYDTEVIANRMYLEMYRFRDFGHGTALAVILFLAVVPAMIINVRNLRRQRSEQ
jgi:alpha-glucoside transport system permease protein